MHVTKQICTPELAQTLGLGLHHVGREVCYNTRARAALVTTVIDMGRDGTRTERTLVSRNETFVVAERTIGAWGRQPRWVFVIRSPRALSSAESSRLQRFGEFALACHLPKNRAKRFTIELLDETRPIPPVPLSKLINALKAYSAMLTKDMCLSSSIDMVVPVIVPRADASRLYAHIEASGGRGLSLLEILVFKLAYQRHQTWVKEHADVPSDA